MQYLDVLRSCALIVAEREERESNTHLGEHQVEYKLHKALEVT